MREQLTETVAFRITRAERARIESIAEATGRRPSDILRRLLSLAEATGQADLILASQATRKSKEVRK